MKYIITNLTGQSIKYGEDFEIIKNRKKVIDKKTKKEKQVNIARKKRELVIKAHEKIETSDKKLAEIFDKIPNIKVVKLDV